MRSRATARKLHRPTKGPTKMRLAHQTYVPPAVAKLSSSGTAKWLPYELPGQAQGSSTATIRAAQRPAPNGQAAATAAPRVDSDPRVSFVVVRDGLAESFPLGVSARDAFSSEIATLPAGANPDSRHGVRQRVPDVLSGAERRVLRYLPTNLTAREIADELYVSVNTVKTHMRHIYATFDAHRRRDAVERARALGLLPGSKHRVGNGKPWPNSRAAVSSGAYRKASTFGGMR
jgi:DNA-binding CsgD family transcriptional regulator